MDKYTDKDVEKIGWIKFAFTCIASLIIVIFIFVLFGSKSNAKELYYLGNMEMDVQSATGSAKGHVLVKVYSEIDPVDYDVVVGKNGDSYFYFYMSDEENIYKELRSLHYEYVYSGDVKSGQVSYDFGFLKNDRFWSGENKTGLAMDGEYWTSNLDPKIKIFDVSDGNDSIRNYYLYGDTSGQLNIDIEQEGMLVSDVEIPKLKFDDYGYNASLTNSADDLYIEVQGRWYSVADIELFKQDAMWKYKYNTILKSDLETWVSFSDRVSSTQKIEFRKLGADSWNRFLLQYPVDERGYSGGTNSVGNYFSGYTDALNNFKAFLKQPEYAFNGLEVYIRYYWFDNGQIKYSNWTHWYDAMAKPDGSSGSQWDDKENIFTESQSDKGLTSSQKDNLESTGYSKGDSDAITKYINNTNEELATKKIWDIMQEMIKYMGSFPQLVRTVFSFLPAWIFELIAVGIGFIIVLRFLGR